MSINAILLSGGLVQEPVISEKLAAASNAITPGMLIEEHADGTVRRHSTAAGNAQRLFALENLAVAGDIDTAYAVSSTVRYAACRTGHLVYGLVAASASAIVIGDALESAGNGTVRKAATDAATDTTQRDSIVGYATVALDNSGGGSSARLQFRVA